MQSPSIPSPPSPWEQAAQNYIDKWINDPDHLSQVETLRYLLVNACGIDNAVPLTEIVDFLRSLGLPFSDSVPAFQNNVLGPLKAAGALATLVYPGKRGGLFIPVDEREVRRVSRQALSRVLSEVDNLVGMRGGHPILDGLSEADLHDLRDHIERLCTTSGEHQ